MMKTDFIQTSQAWPTTSSWEQYERIRLERLKEQRQRMENMKEVVEQYSRIISELQTKNRSLESQNEELRGILQQREINFVENYNFNQKYAALYEQLERERKLRQSCEITINELRKQLQENEISHLYSPYNYNQKYQTEIETDYQVLQGLYEQLKDEVYFLHKQNLSLKEVIQNQSRNCYTKDVFWKGQNKPGMIRVSSTMNLKSQPQMNNITDNPTSNNIDNLNSTLKLSFSEKESQSNISKSNNQNTSNPNSMKKINRKNQPGYENQVQKILREEIRKQAELINKFKQNEEKQLNLIQLLKNQKTKLCLCHTYGKSSKKILNSKRQEVVSFKNQ